jgi:type II restriction enzyme
LREERELISKGWLLDVMRCIEMLNKSKFSLADIYQYESCLTQQYPDNKHIKDKIRQQFQILRNNGYLKFLGRGRYQLI